MSLILFYSIVVFVCIFITNVSVNLAEGAFLAIFIQDILQVQKYQNELVFAINGIF